MHCRPYFVYVTLLNFYLAALVKTFVKHFVNCHSGFYTNQSLFSMYHNGRCSRMFMVLVSFYVINVTFVEFLN